MKNLDIIQSKDIPANMKLQTLLELHGVKPEYLWSMCKNVGGFNARGITLLEVRGYIKKGYLPMQYYSMLTRSLGISIGSQEDNDFVDVLKLAAKDKAETSKRHMDRLSDGLMFEARPAKGYVGEWLLIVMHAGGYNLNEMAQLLDTYPRVLEAVISGHVLLGERAIQKITARAIGLDDEAITALRIRNEKEKEHFRWVNGAEGILAAELGNITSSSDFLPIYSRLLKEHKSTFSLAMAAEAFNLPLSTLTNALKNYNKRGITNHTLTQNSIDTLGYMTKAIACDAAGKVSYKWAEDILFDLGMKRLPRQSLDKLVQDFFENEGSPDASLIVTDKPKIAEESKRLARKLGAIGRRKWPN